jgi:membrane protease YdiL (CAAX protease family)
MTTRTSDHLEGVNTKTAAAATDNPSLRPLLRFAAIAVPAGWVLLSIPLLTGLPDEPFILSTLVLGLVVPTVLMTYGESGRIGVRALLRDTIRVPRPLIWLPVAATALPIGVWSAATAAGGAPPISAAFLAGWAATLMSSFIIVNLAEEMAWTGFVQRRAMARWGIVRGSVVTAILFAGVHLPLAFAHSTTAGDVAEGVAVLFATGISLRLIVACVDRWSGRSLLTIGLLHASFNSTGDLGSTWTRLAITAAFALVAVAACQVGRHRSTARAH